jgi:RND family efflux transporter MFP subunit
VLEAPELMSSYEQAQADVNTKWAIYKGSQANYGRLYRTSETPGTISPNDLDLALARAAADSAQWKAAQASFRQANDLLDYLTIRAPFDGVITARNVSSGAYVGPGDKNTGKPLLILQERRTLRLTMNVTEEYAGYLRNRDTVSFTVNALPGKRFMAHISRMAGGIDPQTRTEQVEMDVDNRGGLLLPEMYAEVSLVVRNDDQAMVVPRSALVTNAEKVFVIKVVNQRAVWVDVRKIFENPTRVTIAGNLIKGDTLVTNATEEIREGTVLRLVGG